jgi:hypothetical protein
MSEGRGNTGPYIQVSKYFQLLDLSEKSTAKCPPIYIRCRPRKMKTGGPGNRDSPYARPKANVLNGGRRKELSSTEQKA